jgi:hypothetical protein
LLGGRGVFHGDVPAALLALGAPKDMKDYCKKLVD